MAKGKGKDSGWDDSAFGELDDEVRSNEPTKSDPEPPLPDVGVDDLFAAAEKIKPSDPESDASPRTLEGLSEILDAGGLPSEADMDIIEMAAPTMPDAVSEDVFKWLRGEAPIPQEIAQFGEDVATKMSWFIAYTQLTMFARIPALMKYMTWAESQLFGTEPGRIVNLTEIHERYKLCSVQLMKILEFSRKFAHQYKDSLKSNATEEEKLLLSKLKALSPEAKKLLLAALKQVE